MARVSRFDSDGNQRTISETVSFWQVSWVQHKWTAFQCIFHDYRVKAAIENNRLQLLDSSVDGGQWYAAKREAVYKDIPETCRPPILPITGWQVFPSVAVPPGFSWHLIENYLIERHPTLSLDDVDSDGELVAADTMSVGTKKPLKRGEQYRKSEHVTEVGDNVTSAHYFIRAIVLSSFHKNRSYRVFVTCSRSTAFVVEGICECRQRALGRCSHVAALLLYVLDHVRNHGFDGKSNILLLINDLFSAWLLYWCIYLLSHF